MKSKILLLILSILMLCCCSKNQESEVLSEKELVAVLVDIHLFDATVATYNTLNKTKLELSQECYDQEVLQKHNCSDSLFRRSVEYYTLSGTIKKIYGDVVDSLSELRTLNESKLNQQ